MQRCHRQHSLKVGAVVGNFGPDSSEDSTRRFSTSFKRRPRYDYVQLRRGVTSVHPVFPKRDEATLPAVLTKHACLHTRSAWIVASRGPRGRDHSSRTIASRRTCRKNMLGDRTYLQECAVFQNLSKLLQHDCCSTQLH